MTLPKLRICTLTISYACSSSRSACPHQYITRQKIEKAKDLLAATSGSVSEIADQLGFGDLFYFSRQFKKHAGLAPTEFRKQETGGVKL